MTITGTLSQYTGKDHEPTWRATTPVGCNVFAVENDNDRAYSAITFRDNHHVEMLAVGTGLSNDAPSFFNFKCYIESSSKTGNPQDFMIDMDGAQGFPSAGFNSIFHISGSTSKITITPFNGLSDALQVNGNLSIGAVGTGLQVKEGSNAKQGTATLVGGTVTIPNASVTANSRIFLTIQSLGTVITPSALGITARTPGASFTISSSASTDTSTVAWEIFEPTP